MYLSLLRLDPSSRLAQRSLADIVSLHRTVMSGFADAPSNNARQTLGVLHRVDEAHGQPTLLVQSRAEPDWSLLSDALIHPATPRKLDRLLDRLRENSQWRFRVVASATAACTPEGPRERGRRRGLYRKCELEQWLLRTLGTKGAQLQRSGLLTFMARDLGRITGRRNGHTVILRQADFQGTLTITNSTLLRATLAEGIGRGKAWGCGLITLAPVP